MPDDNRENPEENVKERAPSFTTPLIDFHHACVAVDGGIAPGDGTSSDSSASRWAQAVCCIRALEELRKAECPRPGEAGPSPGLRFDRFEIRAEIGRGGHGIVYLAFDPDLKRLVALKVPRPDLVGDEEWQNRFLREARAAAALDHPNLVPVYEIGVVGPACFIATQYCPGPSLARWLRAFPRRPPVRAAAELLAKLAEATAYIHDRGIVHRDIKPGNILLDPIDSESAAEASGLSSFVPKLADFGLARFSGGNSAGQTGAPFGTPAYMSPEQASGPSSAVGPPSDIYSLGVVLYELLTGTTPYQGKDGLETLRRIQEGKLVPPARIERGVPRDLDAICLKCLAREPGRRYASAAELADDLKRFLGAEPVHARPPGVAARLVLWSRRQPVVTGLTAAIIVGAAAAFGLVAWQWRTAVGNERQAEANFAQAHRSLREIHDQLFREGRYDDAKFQPLRRDVVRTLLGFYDDLLRGQPENPELIADVAEAHYHAGYVSECSSEMAEAERSYRRALELWTGLDPDRRSGSRDTDLQMKTSCHLAHLRDIRGDFTDAAAGYREALRLGARLLAQSPRCASLCGDVADIHHGFAANLKARGRLHEALRHLRSEQTLRERQTTCVPATPADPLKLAACQYKIAQALTMLGRDEEARSACGQALAVLRATIASSATDRDPDHLGRAAELLHLEATIVRALGDGAGFLTCQEQSRALYERLVREQPDNPRWLGGGARCELALATFHEHKEAFDRAAGCYEWACRWLEQAAQMRPEFARYALDAADARTALAGFQIRRRQFADAGVSLERAARLCTSSTERTRRAERSVQRVARRRRQLADALRQQARSAQIAPQPESRDAVASRGRAE